jgi:hypothetical protein
MIARKGMLTRERKASEQKFQLKFKSQSCNATQVAKNNNNLYPSVQINNNATKDENAF